MKLKEKGHFLFPSTIEQFCVLQHENLDDHIKKVSVLVDFVITRNFIDQTDSK